MTAQQVGEPSTCKGDPQFMQHLNNAWHKASKAEKEELKRCVHTDHKGDVVRIDAIKNHPELENLSAVLPTGKRTSASVHGMEALAKTAIMLR